jgi:hypothetical protein
MIALALRCEAITDDALWGIMYARRPGAYRDHKPGTWTRIDAPAIVESFTAPYQSQKWNNHGGD